MPFTIANDGDSFEKKYWNLFLQQQFPSYEIYWHKRITSLTKRPTSIHFKDSATLIALGIDAEEVCKAQLHYTILRQLAATYEIMQRLKKRPQTFGDSDVLAEGLFHIGAAQDVAFEFLQRMKSPRIYDPWTANRRTSASRNTIGSQEACKKWKDDNSHPLSDVREYRNHLTHGRMPPAITDLLGILYLPKIGQELNNLDWRNITDPIVLTSVPVDFDTVENILNDAWHQTLDYFENQWQTMLSQIP